MAIQDLSNEELIRIGKRVRELERQAARIRHDRSDWLGFSRQISTWHYATKLLQIISNEWRRRNG